MFIDGFGEKRFYCKNCKGSFPVNRLPDFIDKNQLTLNFFKVFIHTNPRAVI